MNDRIEELAKQADPEQWHSRWYSGVSPRMMDPEIYKFAELIVKECRLIMSENFHECNTATKMDKIIKEHFGGE